MATPHCYYYYGLVGFDPEFHSGLYGCCWILLFYHLKGQDRRQGELNSQTHGIKMIDFTCIFNEAFLQALQLPCKYL